MVSHDHPWTFQKEWSKEDITNSYKEWIAITDRSILLLRPGFEITTEIVPDSHDFHDKISVCVRVKTKVMHNFCCAGFRALVETVNVESISPFQPTTVHIVLDRL